MHAPAPAVHTPAQSPEKSTFRPHRTAIPRQRKNTRNRPSFPPRNSPRFRSVTPIESHTRKHPCTARKHLRTPRRRKAGPKPRLPRLVGELYLVIMEIIQEGADASWNVKNAAPLGEAGEGSSEQTRARFSTLPLPTNLEHTGSQLPHNIPLPPPLGVKHKSFFFPKRPKRQSFHEKFLRHVYPSARSFAHV